MKAINNNVPDRLRKAITYKWPKLNGVRVRWEFCHFGTNLAALPSIHRQNRSQTLNAGKLMIKKPARKSSPFSPKAQQLPGNSNLLCVIRHDWAQSNRQGQQDEESLNGRKWQWKWKNDKGELDKQKREGGNMGECTGQDRLRQYT